MAKDPICNMDVDERTAKFKSEYGGKTYYFCSKGCKETFDKNPTKHTGESGHSKQSMHSGHSCC